MQAQLEQDACRQQEVPYRIGELLYLQQFYRGKPPGTVVTVEVLTLDASGWTAQLRVRTQKGPTDMIPVPARDFPLLGATLPDKWTIAAVLGPK